MPGTQSDLFAMYHRALLHEGKQPINRVVPAVPRGWRSYEPKEGKRTFRVAGVVPQGGGDVGCAGQSQGRRAPVYSLLPLRSEDRTSRP